VVEESSRVNNIGGTLHVTYPATLPT